MGRQSSSRIPCGQAILQSDPVWAGNLPPLRAPATRLGGMGLTHRRGQPGGWRGRGQPAAAGDSPGQQGAAGGRGQPRPWQGRGQRGSGQQGRSVGAGRGGTSTAVSWTEPQRSAQHREGGGKGAAKAIYPRLALATDNSATRPKEGFRWASF